MRVTRRGYAVLAAGAPLLAAGWWDHNPLLGALGAILLGAVAAAVLTTGRTPRVVARRSLHPNRVTRGRPALARLKVSNAGTRRQAPFTATDPAGPIVRTVQVHGLLPGAEAVLHYELPTGTRGKWTVGPLTLERRDGFGLAGSSLPAGETTTLWVHPRQLPARALFGGQRRHHHQGRVTDRALRGSVELTDVREYVPGDEVRLLHWKATARTGQLMVRDLADPQRGRFTVLLDTRAAAATVAQFEELVEIAASLLTASVRAGQHTCLVTSAGRQVAVDGGAQAAHRLLDALSELTQDDDRPTLPSTRGGNLVVVCGSGPQFVPPAWLRGGFAQVYAITMGEPVDVPGARTLRAASAEDAVRQWNQLTA
jgi:uncharacterized protein (DUF58 family)